MDYDNFLKILPTAGLVLGGLVGLFQFLQVQQIEAARPFLEKKLEWCVDAVETAALIGTRDHAETEDAQQHFRELYWGVMGMIEKQHVTRAMIDFGNELEGGDRKSLPGKALAIAHACREELAADWSASWRR